MKKIFCLIMFSGFLACGQNSGQNVRVNPTPPPVTDNAGSNNKFANIPVTNVTPVPAPVLELGNHEFEVEVKFNAVLGRIILDNGETTALPAKFRLKGGEHKFFVYDLVTSCTVNKTIVVDKDAVFDFKMEEVCF